MNDEDYPEKPSGFLLGKEFIIVIVIVFSGMSFTLGYFVGKNTGGSTSVPALQADALPGQQAVQQNLREASQTQQSQTPEPYASHVSVQEPPQSAAREPVSVNAEAPVSIQEHQTSQGSTPKQRAQPKTFTTGKGDGPAPKTEVHPVAEDTDTVYAVQIGAFKSPAEARQRKATFEKKGYKAYIVTSMNTKGQKIYKVKTGEFRKKKEAEVLALKLKNTEKLPTYVTAGTE